MNPRRRELLKGVGTVGGIAIGAKSLQEAGSEVVDMLNGECDTKTDTLTLGPGDAVHYRHGDQTYYLAYTDNVEGTVQYGPVDGSIETIDIPYTTPDDEDSTRLTYTDASLPMDLHVNLGDALTGGDVVEPRGLFGLTADNIKATYDDPVCVVERGEASELGSTYR